MSRRANALGYEYSSCIKKEQTKDLPLIRLKSVTKNESLSHLLKPNRIPLASKQTLINFDYLLFVFMNPNDNPNLQRYLSHLKSSKLLNPYNIIFFTKIQDFPSLIEQVTLTTCHKRMALLIGQVGIVNNRQFFKQIHEIYVVVDSTEKYSDMKYLMDDKNMKAIIYDLGQVDLILIDMNVIMSKSDMDLLPSNVCRESVKKIKTNSNGNEQARSSKINQMQHNMQHSQSNAQKQHSLSQLGYQNKQNSSYIDKSTPSIAGYKRQELLSLSMLKNGDQNHLTEVKVSQKIVFSQKSSNINQSEKSQFGSSCYEQQIRKVALDMKSRTIQVREQSVYRGNKKSASEWYKKYVTATNKQLSRNESKDWIRENQSSEGQFRTREGSFQSSSNNNSGHNWLSSFRRDSNLSSICRDEYQMTSHKWK